MFITYFLMTERFPNALVLFTLAFFQPFYCARSYTGSLVNDWVSNSLMISRMVHIEPLIFEIVYVEASLLNLT